ncbi:hypothetical protein D6817_00075 [Candidatus Pacearchaeota archaeon]|nr:MAG: hypothetical protein D6817_00075 [Candidatus Pacearchaeota archaeon]
MNQKYQSFRKSERIWNIVLLAAILLLAIALLISSFYVRNALASSALTNSLSNAASVPAQQATAMVGGC